MWCGWQPKRKLGLLTVWCSKPRRSEALPVCTFTSIHIEIGLPVVTCGLRLLVHGLLDTTIIEPFASCNHLANVESYLWHHPLPMFSMAVGEAEIGRPIVPIGWHVPPITIVPTPNGRAAEVGVLNGVFIFIDEKEDRGRKPNILCVLPLIDRNVREVRWSRFCRAVDRQA